MVVTTPGKASSWNVIGRKACLVLFKKVRILPELEATQNISNYGRAGAVQEEWGWEATEQGL